MSGVPVSGSGSGPSTLCNSVCQWPVWKRTCCVSGLYVADRARPLPATLVGRLCSGSQSWDIGVIVACWFSGFG